jgi:hypothetical protein
MLYPLLQLLHGYHISSHQTSESSLVHTCLLFLKHIYIASLTEQQRAEKKLDLVRTSVGHTRCDYICIQSDAI